MADADDDILKEKIDALNNHAWEVRVTDSPKSFELSTESVHLSKKITYTKGLAEGLRSLGFCYVRLAKNEKALELLNEALSLFEKLNDLRGQSTVYEYLGIIQRNWGNLAQSLELIFKAIILSEKIGFLENASTNNYQVGVTYRSLGNFDRAIDYLYKSLTIAKEINYVLMQGYALNVIGSVYLETGDNEQALKYFSEALTIREAAGDKWGEAGSLDYIGLTFLKMQKNKKAIEYCEKSLAITKATNDQKGQSNSLFHLAEAHQQANDFKEALLYSNESLQIRKATGDKRGEAEILLFLAGITKKDDKKVLELLSDALKIAEDIKAIDLSSKARLGLCEFYKEKKDYEKAVKQLDLHIELEKEIHKNTVSQKVLNLEISYKAEETKKEAEVVRKKNEDLTILNKQVEEQKQKLELAFTDLKAAQAQLVQSEKMASLGELTAGIAHEIQNPLNFVNNFSEINTELINELETEAGNGNLEEVRDIVKNIKDNEEKINHHGKRADAIVKSMLQHSRASSGQKELTDINLLIDEYLRLAYHGLRAKDKSFNAEFKTDFDGKIGKINIVQQDIGRVLLNLFNNAFYAVNEKLKTEISKHNTEYKPTVSVQTKRSAGAIEIIVNDNGNGIPDAIKEKIFQPFFTTKPTGQGTGLGLSLSYDIIKAHGGKILIETNEGRGTKFLIYIPT